MPRILLNFEDVDPEGGYTIFDEGVYTATIDTSQTTLKEAQNENKTKYVSITLHVTAGDKKGRVFDNIMLEGPGAFKAGQLLNAAGKKVKKGDKNVAFDTNELHNKRVRVRLTKATYESKGETREKNEVTRYLPLEDGAEATSGAALGY